MAKLSYIREIAKKLKPGEGQTIRLEKKHKYKIGEHLYHYTGACRLGENILLGESTVSDVIPIMIIPSNVCTKLVQVFAPLKLSNEASPGQDPGYP